MKNTRSKYLILALFIIGSVAMAQEASLFYFMPNVPQAAYLNPALHNTQNKVVVGIAPLNGFYGFINSELSYSDITSGNDPLKYFKSTGTIDEHFNIPLLFVGLNFRRDHFYFSASEKQPFNFAAGGTLADFFTSGNIPGSDMTADINISGYQYGEYAFNYSRDFLDTKLTVGVTAKILMGKSAFVSEDVNLGIYTAPDADYLRFHGAGKLHVAGPFETSGDNLDNLEINGPDNFNISDYLTNTSNTGFAFDLGANYVINDKFRVAASLIDIGSIKWKDQTSGFNLDGEFTWEGADISDALKNTKKTDQLSNLGDSILNEFSLSSINEEFKTRLNAKLFIGGTYTLNEKLSFGALNKTQFNANGHPFNTFMLSANGNFNNILSLTGSYAISKNSYANVGLGMAVKAGFAQFMIGTGNLISLLALDKTKYTSIRFGMNFRFGHVKSKNDIIKQEVDSL